MWWPRRLTMQPTSVRDWYCLLTELGPRVVDAIRAENHYGRVLPMTQSDTRARHFKAEVTGGTAPGFVWEVFVTELETMFGDQACGLLYISSKEAAEELAAMINDPSPT